MKKTVTVSRAELDSLAGRLYAASIEVAKGKFSYKGELGVTRHPTDTLLEIRDAIQRMADGE